MGQPEGVQRPNGGRVVNQNRLQGGVGRLNGPFGKLAGGCQVRNRGGVRFGLPEIWRPFRWLRPAATRAAVFLGPTCAIAAC